MGRGQRERRREAAALNPQPSSSSTLVPGAPFSWSPHFPCAPSSSRSSAVHPTPATGNSPAPNYASTKGNKIDDFRKYLHESGDPGLSNTIIVNYKQMMALRGLGLTIATCNDRHNSIEDWIKPGGKKFLEDQKYGDESGRRNISFVFSDFPKSIQKVEDFLSEGDLVYIVNIFGRECTITSATPHGRHFPFMLIAALGKNHAKGKFWNGEYSIADMVIFDYKSKSSCSKRIKILKDPVEAHRWTKGMCDQAKVKDMRTVADLIESSYKVLPLYFDVLIDDLKTVTSEEVWQPWFREYLSYHAALMPSKARKCLETSLFSTYTNCNVYGMNFMAAKPTMYPDNWKKELMEAEKNYVSALLKQVHSHGNAYPQHDKYDESVRGLLQFKRNVLEHGGQNICIEPHHLWHLELCAANMFSKFLPSLLRTLLRRGLMQQIFADDWKCFTCQALV